MSKPYTLTCNDSSGGGWEDYLYGGYGGHSLDVYMVIDGEKHCDFFWYEEVVEFPGNLFPFFFCL